MGRAIGNGAAGKIPHVLKAGRKAGALAALVLAAAAPAQPADAPDVPFDPGKAGFTARYKGETSPYRVNGVFLMPGETLELEVRDPSSDAFVLAFAEGTGVPARTVSRPEDARTGGRAWKWRAPQAPGTYALTLSRVPRSTAAAADTMRFNAFVMVPIGEAKGEFIRGYRVGPYPRQPLKGMAFYRVPKGFILADREAAQTLISPHFRLGQFLCKQAPSGTPVLLLKERLVLKLETVLAEVNAKGHRCETFHVMSGYRTPFYNRSLGNVKFSAHQYGGAADIFIDDHPRDGMMDDLNGDGRSDGKDSEILFEIVDGMSANEYYLPYLGGVGKYNRNEAHGPFVHVDVRGFRAVW